MSQSQCEEPGVFLFGFAFCNKAVVIVVIVMLAISIFRAAMLAEPPATEIEEVIGLVH